MYGEHSVSVRTKIHRNTGVINNSLSLCTGDVIYLI